MARIQKETDSLQKTEARTWKEWLDTAKEDPLSARFGVFVFAHSYSGFVLDRIGRLYRLGGAFEYRRVGPVVRENSSSGLFASDPHDHIFW